MQISGHVSWALTGSLRWRAARPRARAAASGSRRGTRLEGRVRSGHATGGSHSLKWHPIIYFHNPTAPEAPGTRRHSRQHHSPTGGPELSHGVCTAWASLESRRSSVVNARAELDAACGVASDLRSSRCGSLSLAVLFLQQRERHALKRNMRGAIFARLVLLLIIRGNLCLRHQRAVYIKTNTHNELEAEPRVEQTCCFSTSFTILCIAICCEKRGDRPTCICTYVCAHWQVTAVSN